MQIVGGIDDNPPVSVNSGENINWAGWLKNRPALLIDYAPPEAGLWHRRMPKAY